MLPVRAQVALRGSVSAVCDSTETLTPMAG
jgi:hypothetical protein